MTKGWYLVYFQIVTSLKCNCRRKNYKLTTHEGMEESEGSTLKF